MMRKARLVLAAAIVVIFLVALSGCGKESSSSSGTAESSAQPTIQELAKEDAKTVGFDGEVFATTFQEGKEGYLIAESESPDRIVVIDKKNQRMAYVSPANALQEIKKQTDPKSLTHTVIATYTVPKDSRDQDEKAGAWEGETHKIPIYALFTVDDSGKIVPGRLTTGYGLAPSHYQTPLYEAKNVDMANIVLTDALELLPNLKLDLTGDKETSASSKAVSKNGADTAYPVVHWKSAYLGQDVNAVMRQRGLSNDSLQQGEANLAEMGIVLTTDMQEWLLLENGRSLGVGLQNNKIRVVAGWPSDESYETVGDFIRGYCGDNQFFSIKPKLNRFTLNEGETLQIIECVMCWKIDGGYFIINYLPTDDNIYECTPKNYTIIDDMSLSKAFAKN